MRLDRPSDFPRVLYCEKIPHDLIVMFRLPREAKRRVVLFCNFGVGHHLDLCDAPGGLVAFASGFGTLPFINANRPENS